MSDTHATPLRELKLEEALRRLLSEAKKLAQAVDVSGLPPGYTDEDLNELGCAEHEAEILLPAAAPADPTLRGKTRQVEMIVCLPNTAGDVGMWHTEYVEVPADTPEARIGDVADAKLRAAYEAQNQDVAFIGVYNLPKLSHQELQCEKCGAEYEEGARDFCTGCGRCFGCCLKNPDCPAADEG